MVSLLRKRWTLPGQVHEELSCVGILGDGIQMVQNLLGCRDYLGRHALSDATRNEISYEISDVLPVPVHE